MKKIITSTSFLSVILLVAFSSCTHYYYIPQAQNVPLFQEKNEYRLGTSAGGNNEVNTTDIQAAYSISNHMAVMANVMVADGGEKSSGDWGIGKYYDAGIGYYKAFGKHLVFEVFGGIGNSKQHHRYDKGTADLRFRKVFLQPSIGITYNGFDIALTAGISNINFYKINNPLDKNLEEYFIINNIAEHKNSYLFEPALTIRGGWKYAKMQVQLQSAQNLSHRDLQFLYSKVSVGVLMSLAKKFEKKEAKKTIQNQKN